MKQKNIVLFDMDDTLVLGDTTQLWGAFLVEKGIIDTENQRIREEFHHSYLQGTLDLRANYEHEIATIKKIPHAERESIRQIFFKDCVQPILSEPGLQLIKSYKQQSNTLVIMITATLSFLACPVAEYAQVHDLIATEEEIYEGEFSGKLWGIPSIGFGKVTRFERWLEKSQIQPLHTVMYTDSHNDLPLLSRVHKPIAVDPDPRLKEVALANSWDVISLR